MTLDDTRIRAAAEEVVSGLIGRRLRERETLISSGLIDSLSVLKLIARLEERLGVTIPTDTLQPDDFDDISVITETVRRVAG